MTTFYLVLAASNCPVPCVLYVLPFYHRGDRRVCSSFPCRINGSRFHCIIHKASGSSFSFPPSVSNFFRFSFITEFFPLSGLDDCRFSLGAAFKTFFFLSLCCPFFFPNVNCSLIVFLRKVKRRFFVFRGKRRGVLPPFPPPPPLFSRVPSLLVACVASKPDPLSSARAEKGSSPFQCPPCQTLYFFQAFLSRHEIKMHLYSS